MKLHSPRVRRTAAVLIAAGLIAASTFYLELRQDSPAPSASVTSEPKVDRSLASEALEQLEIKGRAPKTGYSRDQFGGDWGEIDFCDLRNLILRRDLTNLAMDTDGCVVLAGTLESDPYTGKRIGFLRGADTSRLVQIDHVVALSDAWQKGAQQLSEVARLRLANDGLNLLAVDGMANQQKGAADAASWLPPNKSYRCPYVARQVAVKAKYDLWITKAEKNAMTRVLLNCPNQRLPSSRS